VLPTMAAHASRPELHELSQPECQKMSAPLIVSIPHRLGREEATRRLKTGLTRAAASVPILQIDEEKWEGDRLVFRVRALGQAASGHLDVTENDARLEVTPQPLPYNRAFSLPNCQAHDPFAGSQGRLS
jgi:hypothetical protein